MLILSNDVLMNLTANKDVVKKKLIFTKTVLNILKNFIPHEVIVCDNKDPPWFNGKNKLFFNEKLRTLRILKI